MMKKRIFYLFLSFGFASLGAACGSSSTQNNVDSQNIPSIRDYMVINFGNDNLFDLTINDDIRQLIYTDVSNDTNSSVSFSQSSDGIISSSDSLFSNILEYPEVGLIVNMTDSVGIGIQSQDLDIQSLVGEFNTMQFRPGLGFEGGCSSVESSGNADMSTFFPADDLNDPSYFDNDDSGNMFELPNLLDHGSYLTYEDEGSLAYIFGSEENQFFILQVEAGPIMFVPRAQSKNFNESWAGNYNVMFFLGNQNDQGVPTYGTNTLSLTREGVLQAEGEEHQLIPLPDVPEMNGAGKLEQSCNGSFVYDTSLSTNTFHVMSFVGDNVILFANYRPTDGGFEYSYGMAARVLE